MQSIARVSTVLLFVISLSGCSIEESTLGEAAPAERSADLARPDDNNAFGNVQPHHVREEEHHGALVAYGPHAMFVCNASLEDVELLDDLRGLVGRDVTLLANDPSRLVPLWGPQSPFWNDYRAAMDPANVGLPDSAWYWISEYGFRMPAPRPCRTGGWCGEYWPGWALKPDTAAYRAKGEFLASRLGEFDGLFLDEWQAGFAPYQMEGLGIPPEDQEKLTKQWEECRRFYVNLLRESLAPGFLLVANIQPSRRAAYLSVELASFDGHTTEYPDIVDLSRFSRHPSRLNVGWGGVQSWEGVVRTGYGLPANVDP